jgi:Lon protease-like protein
MTQSPAEQRSQILPVFPLPETVLFPHALLPLHIFEPRYRTMVQDVSDGLGLIVVARQVGDGFEPLGTVGRLHDLTELEDGRYNMMLEGTERVTLTEVDCDTPYRQVSIVPCPERTGSDDPEVIQQSKLEVLASLGILLSAAKGELPTLLNPELPLDVLVNRACASLPIEGAIRQQILAENDLLARQRRLSQHLDDLIASITWKGFEGSGDRSRLN